MFGATKVTTGKFIVFKRFILFKNKTFNRGVLIPLYEQGVD